MRRRQLVALVAVSILTGLAIGIAVARPPDKESETSPHAAALKLVIDTQADRIRVVDQGDWWLDVKERSWVVKRPFGPGDIDSTHWFNVSYRVEGKEVASWFVDTRTGKAQEGSSAK